MLAAPLARAREVTRDTAELYRPPRRALPSETARDSLRNEKDVWSEELAPMMVEPMNALASREYQGIVFVGPARSSKTFSLVLGGICWIVKCAPGDVLVVHISQDTARDFSRGDLDRTIRHSPELATRISPRARDDNTFDKFFRSGMFVKLGWPSVSQLSAKSIKYVFVTDYDRPENRDDVDGEGSLWDLATKRIETYMSRGKCVAESSPGEDLVDRNWKPSTVHEAPPVLGILSLYNRGTRARWHWGCVHCNARFEAAPGLAPFKLPPQDALENLVQSSDLMGLAEQYAHIGCPRCGGLHELADRTEMNANSAWLHEGQSFGERNELIGDRRRTLIASYWLGGVAAAYQRWDGLLLKYFQALLTYVKTGDEGPMRTTTMTDQAMPYLPRHIAKRRSIDDYKDKLEDWPRGMVPKGVRFLTTAVDVQGNRFVVHVMGWGVMLESWLVDRYAITASDRMEGDRNAALQPAAYAEDWNVLIPVIDKTYPVDGIEGVVMGIQVTLCDSGGTDGVTQRAYEFYRQARDAGYAKRFALVKGDGRFSAPRTLLTWPDTRNRKSRDAGGRGDVPVYLLNSNLLKDAIVGNLAREQPGPGYVHLPRWVDKEFFDELTAEERTAKGWERTKHGARNEAFDLHYYNRAACILLKAETIDWQSPPAWAREPVPEAKTKAQVLSLGDLARSLNS